MKVSACVIAKNEENNIGRCLDSMKDHIDEIILVDTGSDDRTAEIARARGAKVYDYIWENDFSKAKNFAIEKASGDWIIFLDADEYFADEDSVKKAIFYMREHMKTKLHALICRIINIDTDRDNQEISSFMNLRIFRNLPNLRYRYEVHEELYNKKGTLDLVILNDEVEIYHTGYSTHIIEAKLRRNLQIILDDIEKNGENNRHYRYLMDCYHGIGEYDKAIKYAKLHLESGVNILGSQSMVYEKLIICMLHCNKDFLEIKKEIRKAIAAYPKSPIFYMFYAHLHFNYYEYDQSLRFFFKSLEVNKKRNSTEWDSFQSKIFTVYFYIGQIYSLKNETAKAAEYFLKSLKEYKYNEVSLKSLYVLLCGAPEVETIAILNSIYSKNKQRDVLFIVKNLQYYPYTKVYLYYQKILMDQFHVGVPMHRERSLISIRNYPQLYKESSIHVRGGTQLTAVCLLAMNDADQAREKIAVLSASHARIVQSYFALEQLTEDEYLDYRELLDELICLEGVDETLAVYIKCAEPFHCRQKQEIAAVLFNQRLYREAAFLYEAVARDMPEQERGRILAALGRCYYELGDYAAAVSHYREAKAMGADDASIEQFIQWSGEKQASISL